MAYRFWMTSLLTAALCVGVQACSKTEPQSPAAVDARLTQFADWHLGFTTNVKQRDADLAADAMPRWGLSELRFTQIWPEREDGYWLYYETSQPDVRPDRNQIWNLYRNADGELKVDAYNFKDLKAGLALWGKNGDDAGFAAISLEDLVTTPGCNATYSWRAEFERFVGSNAHQECNTIGDSYLLQHVEISKAEDGTLVRNDWHTFYDGDGIAKRGETYKSGTSGPTIHYYTERYKLN